MSELRVIPVVANVCIGVSSGGRGKPRPYGKSAVSVDEI